MTHEVEGWLYASSPDAESWSGIETTREEAIAAGRDDYGDAPFWIAPGIALPLRECAEATADVDRMLEGMDEYCGSNYGGPEDSIFEVSAKDRKAAEADLTRLLGEWAERWLVGPAWLSVDLERVEKIEPSAAEREKPSGEEETCDSTD